MTTVPIHLTDPDLQGYGYRDHTRHATVHYGPPTRIRPGGNLYNPILPPNTVYVGRPGPWGNRHRGDGKPCRPCGLVHTRVDAVDAYRTDLRNNPELVARARRTLYGRNLACWCKPTDQPCHADVLLYIVNGGQP